MYNLKNSHHSKHALSTFVICTTNLSLSSFDPQRAAQIFQFLSSLVVVLRPRKITASAAAYVLSELGILRDQERFFYHLLYCNCNMTCPFIDRMPLEVRNMIYPYLLSTEYIKRPVRDNEVISFRDYLCPQE